jgi:diaminohydroxyphosphoribosylaminopyrimidine deaminase / 5-amino-6-(5-phosphoribosylamino)uracil reductase
MPGTEADKFMRRCLDLAVRAEGLTYPNPMVGAIIVHNGIIIGEGYHLKAGTPHAEVHTINSVTDKSLLKDATLYVTLEPCSHFGKTPPCTNLIISNHIPKVVIGTIDTSSNVSGKGVEQLRNAGCEVISGVMEKECRYLNRRFFMYNEKHRPYITLKWAQSADGFIDIKRSAGSPVEPYWITGTSERVLVHMWRAAEEAILAGAETIRADNPKLNVRYWKGKDPIKLILSRSGELSNYLSGNETNGTVIVFTENTDKDFGVAEKVILSQEVPAALQIVDYLYKKGRQSLLVEGGAMLHNHFIKSGLWDEARVFTGSKCFSEGVKAPVLEGKLVSQIDFETSRLEVRINDFM